MKELYIIRHAKSSWEDLSLSDFDRPLNKRGKRNAPEMGKRLQKKGITPDLIISSPANRALSTARVIAHETSYPLEQIQLEPIIYGASVSEMIRLINQTEDSINRLFVFGHNPTFTDLAEKLSNEYFGNVPTCGVVALQFPFESWSYLSQGTGDLIFYDYPKKAQ